MTPSSPTEPLVVVTQADRDAAADLAQELADRGVQPVDGNDVAGIRNGSWDESPDDLGLFVHAMAKHRLTAAPDVGARHIEGRAEYSPIDDNETKAFIDGWNARLDHSDFDMAHHYWLLGQVANFGISTPQTEPTIPAGKEG